jgi:hypothetical protein
MACTINIQASMNWALPYIRFQPFTIGGQEPALTSANLTAQVMLGAPFSWRWNRGVATFVCTPGEQDYEVPINDFGFQEVASVADTNGLNKEITFKKVLALDGTSNDRPAYIAVQDDDNEGNITFRLSPPPDQAYVVTVTYQKKAQRILSMASSWAPIADEYSYIYSWGFITMAAMLTNDPRLQMYSQKFVGHLLGAQGGLTEREMNIFMSTYLQRTGQVAVAGMSAQQSVTARTF